MKDPNIKNPEDENSASGCLAKKILVVSYSQSGQLDRIVASLLAPLGSQATIIEEKLAPSTPFPFPWPIHQFLDVFPEAFRGIPCPLQPLKSTANDRYDLVIMAYQVWYLAPSIPISSFLQSREAKSLLQGTPILTIVGCRNMWFRAHAIVRNHLQTCGARLVGHVVLADRAYNLVSVVTIVYWMLTGRKDRLLGLFPTPGISERDIAGCSAYGRVVVDALSLSTFPNIQERLNALSACRVVPHLLFLENGASRIFDVWSRLILRRGGPGDPRRKPAVRMFGWYLAFGVAAFTPLSLLMFYLARPFRRSAVDREVNRGYLNRGSHLDH
jgi:hypothetical protein